MPILPATIRRGISTARSVISSMFFGSGTTPGNDRSDNIQAASKTSVNSVTRVREARLPVNFTLNDRGIDESIYKSVSKIFNDRANKIVTDSKANPKNRIAELNRVCKLIKEEAYQIVNTDAKEIASIDVEKSKAEINTTVDYLRQQHLKRILHDLLGIERNPLYKQMLAEKGDLIPFKSFVLKQIGCLHGEVFSQHNQLRLNSSYLDEHEDDLKRKRLLDEQFIKKYEGYFRAFKDALLDAKNSLLEVRLYCELVDMEPDKLEKAILDLVSTWQDSTHRTLENPQEGRAREILSQKHGLESARETVDIMEDGHEVFLRSLGSLPGNNTCNILVSDLLAELKESPSALFDYLKALKILLQRQEVFAGDTPNFLSDVLEDDDEFKKMIKEVTLRLKKIEIEDVSFERTAVNIDGPKEKLKSLPPTAEFKAEEATLTAEYTQDVKDISLRVKKEVLDVCREVLVKEADIVSALRDKRRTESRRKFVFWGAAAAAVVTVVGVPTSVAVYNSYSVEKLKANSDVRGKRVEQLRNQIQELIGEYESINLRQLYSTACEKAREEMKINYKDGKTYDDNGNAITDINELKKIWNKIFRMQALLLEPSPKRKELEPLIRDFLKPENLDQRKQTPNYKNNEEELQRLDKEFSRYLQGEIDESALSEYLSNTTRNVLAYVDYQLRPLYTSRAVADGEIKGVPEDIIKNGLPEELRRIFAGNWSKAIVGHIYKHKWTLSPVEIIGPEITVIDMAYGKMFAVMTANETKSPDYFFKDPSIRSDVFECWKILHRTVDNSFTKDVNEERISSDIQLLNSLSGGLDGVNDLNELEKQLTATKQNLERFQKVIIPGFARCLTGFEIVEELSGIGYPKNLTSINLKALDKG